MKMSSVAAANASSLCNLSGSLRTPLPPCGLTGRRRKSCTVRRIRALSSSSVSDFFGSMRLNSTPKLLNLQHKQSKRSLSVFAMAAEGIFLSLSLTLRTCLHILYVFAFCISTVHLINFV